MSLTRAEALVELRCKASSFRTICEVHREIYDAAEDLAQPARRYIQALVIDAFIMAKKMDGKLKSYKQDWDAGFYEPNSDRAEDRAKRLTKESEK
jgi:hypothetical protein